jgi:cyclopropane fatty-acyl-phospholipid synthase-like methyltransferase
MAKAIDKCRISGSDKLVSILDLGIQRLTGVFPSSPGADITAGPLELVFCPESGLVQLRHSYDAAEMYGTNYGYRSGLNAAMVTHLTAKARRLEELAGLQPGDVVVDIGSNDGTLLGAYTRSGIRRLGIDPTAEKFRNFYAPGIELVPTFFGVDAYRSAAGGTPAKLVTAVSMFYDLDDPVGFLQEISATLADDGICHLEQSYMPLMFERNAYDTVCHEHLEYYSVQSLLWIADKADLTVLDVELNDVNGGSFAVTLAKRAAKFSSNDRAVEHLLRAERAANLDKVSGYSGVQERACEHRTELRARIRELRDRGKRVFGYGASTKGNVLLQYCGFTTDDIECIAEVNPDKFGCYTPGTDIPIVSEEVAKSMRPDYFLVLPWHFRPGILKREAAWMAEGGGMIFPLPTIDVVNRVV